MAGRQAKVFSESALRRLLQRTETTSTPLRDRVIILLSVRAGLRACEIARLQWSMVTSGENRIGHTIEIPDDIAKYGSGRRVPLHPELRKALGSLSAPRARTGPIIRSQRTGQALEPNSVVNWYRGFARECGLKGCSSHSGRRTFITNAARAAHRVGASLRDIQLLAGHRSIETTQGYIDGDSDAQRRLVCRL